MPRYAYQAVDGAGREQRGALDADSEAAAGATLKERGLFPTAIHPGGGPAPAPASRPAARANARASGWRGLSQITFGRPRLRHADLPAVTRQLATLLDAGLPLVRALRTLEEQADDLQAKRCLGGIADHIENGGTLSEALVAAGGSFDPLYVNMVRAGEASGAMEPVLNRLAEYLEKAARLKAKVKAALVYPAVVMAIAITITMGLMVFVVPKFATMFNDLLGGQPLPVLTQAVLGLSTFLLHHAVLGAGLVIAVVILFRLARRTALGALLWDLGCWRCPPFARLVQKSTVARFSSTLGTLMNAGVNVLPALLIARDTGGNVVVARAVQHIHDAVKEGEGMAGPMRATRVFPPMLVSMLQVGEETGSLPTMLERVARIYSEEVDLAVDGLTALIEPVLIVFLGVVIGGIVMAMFLPLIEIINQITGGS